MPNKSGENVHRDILKRHVHSIIYLSNFATKKKATLLGETTIYRTLQKWPSEVDTHGPNLDVLDIWDHTYLKSDQSSDGDIRHISLTDASEMEMGGRCWKVVRFCVSQFCAFLVGQMSEPCTVFGVHFHQAVLYEQI